MTDTVVSVRMPTSLVIELKKLAEKNHYKDLSEEIRSVVRTKCMKYSQPYSEELTKIRQEISEQLSINEEIEKKAIMIQELKRIIQELKK